MDRPAVTLPPITTRPGESGLPHIGLVVGPDEMARASLAQARYHFVRMGAIMNAPAIRRWNDSGHNDPRRADLIVELNAHLRGFFWELGAAFDCLLHWVNQKHALGIVRPRDVRIDRLRAAALKLGRGETDLATLIAAFNADWCFEVREYRNCAHQALLAVEGLYYEQGDRDSIWVIAPARRGQDTPGFMPLLTRYGEEMSGLVDRLVGLTGPGTRPRTPPSP